MSSEDIKLALDKLENGIDQFEILTKSQEHFPTKEKLQLACVIRDNVVNDNLI